MPERICAVKGCRNIGKLRSRGTREQRCNKHLDQAQGRGRRTRGQDSDEHETQGAEVSGHAIEGTTEAAAEEEGAR